MLDSRNPILWVASPSGQWGSLPWKGAIDLGHHHELREAARPEARYNDWRQSMIG